MPENTRAALPGDLVAHVRMIGGKVVRLPMVAAPERPAPAGWDTLENVR
jgi:hypothetical protein